MKPLIFSANSFTIKGTTCQCFGVGGATQKMSARKEDVRSWPTKHIMQMSSLSGCSPFASPFSFNVTYNGLRNARISVNRGRFSGSACQHRSIILDISTDTPAGIGKGRCPSGLCHHRVPKYSGYTKICNFSAFCSEVKQYICWFQVAMNVNAFW